MKLLFWAITLVDVMVTLVIFTSAQSQKMLAIPLGYRIGILLAALGFAIQGVLNLIWLLFHIDMVLQTLPFWVFKDIGMGIVTGSYIWLEIILKHKTKIQSK